MQERAILFEKGNNTTLDGLPVTSLSKQKVIQRNGSKHLTTSSRDNRKPMNTPPARTASQNRINMSKIASITYQNTQGKLADVNRSQDYIKINNQQCSASLTNLMNQ